jgi:hypothetical protein
MKKLILAIAAVALIAAPAMALDWDFYGSARIQTSYQDFDRGDATTNVWGPGQSNWATQTADYSQSDSDDGVYWDLLGTSRIGARVKGDPVQGRFEFNNGVGTRLLWGQWKINSGLRLRVGQDWRPLASNWFLSGQQINDTGMAGPEGAGNLMSHRGPQLKLIIGEGQNFEVAFIDGDVQANTGNSDVDIYMPVIEANYKFAADTFFVTVGGSYWQYDVEGNGTAGSPDDDVQAWVVGLGGGVNFGPAYIKGDVYYGQNINEINIITNRAWGDASPVADANGNWDDSDDMGALLVAGMRFNDQMAVEAGVGYENKELDTNGPGGKDDETIAYYGHFNYTAAPGVSIIPEIGYVNLLDNANGTDEGDEFYLSVKWQVDF